MAGVQTRHCAKLVATPLLIIFVFLFLSGCAPSQSCPLVKLAEVPLENRSNLLYVTVGINGRAVRLLLDTGAERTVLTGAAVARLGLRRDSSHLTRSVGFGGGSDAWDALVPGIVFGQARLRVNRVAVGHFTLDHLDGPPADGLLGADFLLAFDVDIDPSVRQLTLYRARNCAGVLPPWTTAAAEIPGTGATRDRLLVPIALDHVPGVAILDTGAQATAISTAMALRAGMSDSSLASDRAITAHGASLHPITVRVHRFRELRAGAVRIESPVLAVVSNEPAMGDALLGGDFLHGRRVWLSFAKRRLFVSIVLARQPH